MKRRLERIREPFEQFFKLESSSAILLLGATLLALIMANSPLQEEYLNFWEEHLVLGILDFELDKPLILWINDGLMAIFFFVIGLEIKREIITGELSTMRKAALPVIAALGGAVLPVILFKVLHGDGPGADGWGVPMATDIAFTLGILKLLGNRVPLGLKVFLTAFAIVDDLAAVFVIAIFYSHSIEWDYLGIACFLSVLLFTANLFRAYNKYIFFITGAIIWVLFLESGIHPTMAGIVVAFSIPIKRKVSLRLHMETLLASAEIFKNTDPDRMLMTNAELNAIDAIEEVTTEMQSPLQHLENRLHGWVLYVIMPVFALANAGVVIAGWEGFQEPLVWHITVSMVGGKLIGISVFSLLAVRLGLASLPAGTTSMQIIGVALLGGLGFTMALFIAQLAYGSGAILESAKLGILTGSLIATVGGYFLLKYTLSRNL